MRKLVFVPRQTGSRALMLIHYIALPPIRGLVDISININREKMIRQIATNEAKKRRKKICTIKGINRREIYNRVSRAPAIK